MKGTSLEVWKGGKKKEFKMLLDQEKEPKLLGDVWYSLKEIKFHSHLFWCLFGMNLVHGKEIQWYEDWSPMCMIPFHPKKTMELDSIHRT